MCNDLEGERWTGDGSADRTGYLDAGAPLEALGVLETVAGQLDDDAAGQLLLARAYYASAQLGRAERTLQRVLALDPVDGWARLLLGRTLERASRPQEALTQFRLAAAMEPHPTSSSCATAWPPGSRPDPEGAP